MKTSNLVWLIGGTGFLIFNALMAALMLDVNRDLHLFEAKEEVLVLSTDITPGLAIQEGHFESRRVPVKYLADDVIRYDERKRFIGHRSRTQLPGGTVLLERNLHPIHHLDQESPLSNSPWVNPSPEPENLQHPSFVPGVSEKSSRRGVFNPAHRPNIVCGTERLRESQSRSSQAHR